MAQITSQGRLKLLLKGSNGGPSDPKNPPQFKLSFHGWLLRLVGACSPGLQRPRPRRSGLGVLASSSAHNTNRRLNAGEWYRNSDSDDYDDEEFAEFDKDELSCYRGLVLDIAYRPVNVVCWKSAICLEFTEKADVLEYYVRQLTLLVGPSTYQLYYVYAISAMRCFQWSSAFTTRSKEKENQKHP